MGTKYLVLLQLLFLYPRAILTSNYEIISSYLDCTGYFLGCYGVEKRIENSGKFLDLHGNILMSVLLKLLARGFSSAILTQDERSKFSPCN